MMKRLLIALLAVPFFAHAGPLANAEEGGLRIVLTDEPCALKHAVTNLPLRTTWTEHGKTSEGCYVVTSAAVIAYYDDKTVAMIPLSAFKRVLES